MFPFGTNGKMDASTTRSPSSPYTRIVFGSTTLPIAHVHEGWSAVSASRATQSSTSSSVRTNGPRDANRLDPLAAILRRRQVVETQRRLHARILRDDLHRAARVRVHRPDVH